MSHIPSQPTTSEPTSALDTESASETPHVRHLLVGTHGDLRIKGRWFELAGFSIGSRVSVRVSRKRLLIEVVKEPPEEPPRRSYRRTT
jgi:hypothetical protein